MARFILNILTIVLTLGLLSNLAYSHELPSTLGKAGHFKDSCKGKERCVTVYVAPWCSACRKSLPLIRAMRDRLEDENRVGMKVIAGQDSKQAVDAYAREIGGTVYFDYTGGFYSRAAAKGVPAWLMFDKDMNVLAKFSGSPAGASVDQLVDYLIHQQFKLTKYLKSGVSWSNLS